MIEDKIAVLIVGKQNSGKTTTIKAFQKMHDENDREIYQCRHGWRRVQLFLGKLDAISCLIYFIPASPTETNVPLAKRLNNFKPEMLLIAEQAQGKEYLPTKEFLKNNGYKIIEFKINSEKTGYTWESWIDKNKEIVLDNRAKQIRDVFKKYILERIL